MRVIIITAAALLLAGCGATGRADKCAGWERQTPSSATRAFIVSNDKPFAGQVAGHNRNGRTSGCW